jgi:hypothetical protein
MEPRKVKFPFKTRLSLGPLLDFWERLLAEGKCGMSSLESDIRKKLGEAPELREPIEDLTILEKHQETVDLLMSAVFPPAFWESDCRFLLPSSSPAYAAGLQDLLDGDKEPL